MIGPGDYIIANEIIRNWNGKHDGDCEFWRVEVCTCGLLHYVMAHPESIVTAKYAGEIYRHQNVLDELYRKRNGME